MRPVYGTMILLFLLVTFHGISAAGYGGSNDWTFCKGSCTLGQGDCDRDADCSGNLVCGHDNCKQFNSQAHSQADCCMKPGCILKGNDYWWNDVCLRDGEGIPMPWYECGRYCRDNCPVAKAWVFNPERNGGSCWCKTSLSNIQSRPGKDYYAGTIDCLPHEEIPPVEVKMSSVWKGYHQGNRELPGHLCIDNDLGPISICHTKGRETWPWVAVEIPRSIVRQVKIVNRGDCCGDRTKNMKVWIGDYLPTTTNTEYSQGALIGTFKGPATDGQMIEVTSQNGLKGNFVVVQMTGTEYINLAEIEVFGEYKGCLRPFLPGPGSNGPTSRCYFFSDPKTPAKSWDDAQEGCARMGSTLAPVETQAQQDFIVAGYDASAVVGLFIGGRSTKSSGLNFYWLLTSTAVDKGFTFWGKSEPNFEFEHCMQMDNTPGKYGELWEWNNVNCGGATEHTPYVCAYDL